MVGRFALLALLVWVPCLPLPIPAWAQDVPGIEICTAEKTMERRTSCLQSNVDFLQKTIARLDAQHQQKLDAANRQIDLLKANVAALQKIVGDLQAAQHKPSDEAKKTSAPPDAAAKDTAAKDPTANGTTAKETTKNAVTKDAAKEGGK